MISIILMAGLAGYMLPAATAQMGYSEATAEQARASLGICVDAQRQPVPPSFDEIIAICNSSRDAVVNLYMARESNTAMDLNFLRVYAGIAAYSLVNADLQKNGNTLSPDGCANSNYVVEMFDGLTAATNSEVEDQLSKSASVVRQHLIPWCNAAYPRTSQ